MRRGCNRVLSVDRRRSPGRAATAAGQLVVIADHDDSGAAADSFVAINKIEGVLSVSLVFQFSDDSRASEEA